MDDKIQAFRQPLVTATGIILGFLLNFASMFVKTENQLSDLVAYSIGISVLIGIICLIIVLKRILQMNYPKDKSIQYYQKTLTIFIFGVSISFFGVIIEMFTNFMLE